MEVSESTPNNNIDCNDLIACLQEVEAKFSAFLNAEEGKFLLDNVKKMYVEPDKAINKLKSKFESVVKPVFLEKFRRGNWVGFLLWDDFQKTFRILYNYSLEDPNNYIKAGRYNFISRFVVSPQFKENNFSEPMTDILFSNETTVKQTLIFSWERHHQDELESIPEEIRPVLISFDELGGDRWKPELDRLNEFVDEKYGDEENIKANFNIMAQMISALAEKIMEEEGDNGIVTRATREICERFVPHGSRIKFEPLAICRILLLNRLFDSNWKHLYYVPARFLRGVAVSGVVCAFRELLKPEEYIVLTQIVNRIFSLFHFGFFIQQMHLFALRSATAAIMARNKSHIHGSHIEHGLRNKMGDFEATVGERLLGHQPFYDKLMQELTLSEVNS